MPDKILVLTIIGVILQYSFVALIYLFLLKVSKIIYQDLKVLGRQDFRPRAQAVLSLIDAGRLSFAANQYSIDEALTIGRASTNDIAIDDSFVSHEHVCITKSRGQYLITDLHSTNGTFLNGERLCEETVLKSGDLIKIGPAVFKFER